MEMDEKPSDPAPAAETVAVTAAEENPAAAEESTSADSEKAAEENNITDQLSLQTAAAEALSTAAVKAKVDWKIFHSITMS